MRNHFFNQRYFTKWKPNMAYLLGLLTADGNIHKTTVSIALQNRDVELLSFFQNELGFVSIEPRKDNNSSRVRFNSRAMVDDLLNLGVTPAKSFTIRFAKVPDEFLRDYVRGVFDGDGWVICRRNMIESGLASASKFFLEDFDRAVGLRGRIRERQKKGYETTHYYWEIGKSKSLKFRDIMYYENCMCLKRKRDMFFSDFYKRSTRFWTDEQLKALADNWDKNLSELPPIIGKSYKAISKKKWECRRDGLSFAARF